MSMLLPVSSPKKRKHRTEDNAGPSAKKSKKVRKHRHKRAHSDDEFVLVEASLVVSIPPVFASSPAQGVEEMLDSMLMRYIPTLRGVVLTHSNLRFLQSTAQIQGDSPYAVCNVGFDAVVWSPRVGQCLTGKVNLCSPDHVSLLVHRTFNVSIPRHHIPQLEWVFEYGPAENDPEYGAGSADIQNLNELAKGVGEGADVVMRDGDTAEVAQVADSGGRWVHVLTGLPLGGDAATLEFTVVGLTIANQMLSLIGSIQPDPFSRDHVASAQDILVRTNDPEPVAEDEISSEEDSEAEFGIPAELGRTTARVTARKESRHEETEKEADNTLLKAEKKKRKRDAEGEKLKRKDAEDAEQKQKSHIDGKAQRQGKRKVAHDEERKPRKKKKQKQED